jgi:hypothetical protein
MIKYIYISHFCLLFLLDETTLSGSHGMTITPGKHLNLIVLFYLIELRVGGARLFLWWRSQFFKFLIIFRFVAGQQSISSSSAVPKSKKRPSAEAFFSSPSAVQLVNSALVAASLKFCGKPDVHNGGGFFL